jgi:uncharacterized repeat protein (TIGR01451 family)
MSKQKTMTRWLALSCVVAGVCLLTAGPAVASPPTPAWGIIATSQPTNFAPGKPASYMIKITNVGSGPTDGSDVTITDTLPNGLTPTSCEGRNCAVSGQTVTWIRTGVFEPGDIAADLVPRVEVASTVEGTVINTVSVSGGGAPTVTITEPTTIGSALPFGLASFSAPAIFPDGTPDTQAGGHPYSLTTNIAFNTNTTTHSDFLGGTISGDVKDIQVDPPLGLIGNPQATPMCTQDQFREQICPASSQVGVSSVDFSGHNCNGHCTAVGPMSAAVYNMVPPPGVPAQFAFAYDIGGIHVRTRLNARVHSGGDYGLTVETSGVAQEIAAPLLDNTVTLWGVPADPSHNDQRCKNPYFDNGLCTGTPGTNSGPKPSTAPLKPFLTMPTACPGTPLRTSIEADSWQEPGNFVSREATQPAVEGCGKLPFEPGLEAQPTSTLADSPSGLSVDLHLPPHEGCKEEAGGGVVCENAEAELKDATVTLPAGLVVDPSSADGLAGCPLLSGKDPAQEARESKGEVSGINLETVYGPNCPEASKLGTVEVDTPLVNHPLPGAMYLAQQGANPFKSLLAVYLAVNDPATGVVIKLAGKVTLDPKTGQLSVTFDNNPQLPFEDLKVNLFGGTRGALTTPLTCGSYALATDLTPWSAPEGKDAEPSSLPFGVTGPGGGACVDSEDQAPNTPGFSAGTASPVAGTYSPFVLKLSREDGSQRFGALNVTLPPGLTGKIAGIEQCPQAAIEKVQSRSHEGEGALEQSSPSCPSGSAVGVVHVGAGSGAPYYVTGRAYFAGPYEGAPFSLVIVTPAVAGPFDLGTVVVRAGLFINPSTAQVTVKSDPFPTILDGIPLDIRSVAVEMNRNDFVLNPTSCAVMSVTGEEKSTTGSVASLSSRFQAGGCTTLPFSPSFTASTQGSTSKADGASLVVKVNPLPGQANIAKVDLQLPKQLPSRLTTLQKACTEAQFNANPAGCPEGSVIGSAVAHTPILNNPLVGPAYLVSHGGAAFPDVEFVLQGEGVEIVLDGGTQIKNGITYSKFETVPDAPITSFETILPEGPHSVLGTNIPASAKYSLCGQSLTMPTTITGQNGAVVKQTTKIGITGCPPTRPKVVKKALTRAQKLKAALKVCRTKDRGKSKAKRRTREACEKAAQKRYGPQKKGKQRKAGKGKRGK